MSGSQLTSSWKRGSPTDLRVDERGRRRHAADQQALLAAGRALVQPRAGHVLERAGDVLGEGQRLARARPRRPAPPAGRAARRRCARAGRRRAPSWRPAVTLPTQPRTALASHASTSSVVDQPVVLLEHALHVGRGRVRARDPPLARLPVEPPPRDRAHRVHHVRPVREREHHVLVPVAVAAQRDVRRLLDRLHRRLSAPRPRARRSARECSSASGCHWTPRAKRWSGDSMASGSSSSSDQPVTVKPSATRSTAWWWWDLTAVRRRARGARGQGVRRRGGRRGRSTGPRCGGGPRGRRRPGRARSASRPRRRSSPACRGRCPAAGGRARARGSRAPSRRRRAPGRRRRRRRRRGRGRRCGRASRRDPRRW